MSGELAPGAVAIPIEQVFRSERAPAGSKEGLLLARALEQRAGARAEPARVPYLWNEDRYGLGRSSLFASLAREAREAALARLSRLNLSLSRSIELAGQSFAARMILLSRTNEERSLYALMAADEAAHQWEFERFLPEGRAEEGHAFHPLLLPLGQIIEAGSREALVFVVQVLLEGFGIAHYSGLRAGCLDPAFQEAVTRILRDEARHHGSGLAIHEASRPDRRARDEIFECARVFTRALLDAGWVAAAVGEAAGAGLSPAAKARLESECGLEATRGARVDRMKEMIRAGDSIGLLERLEADGAFALA